MSVITPEMLKKLDWRERHIIALRMGIGQERPHTIREVAVRLGMTRGRVQWIQKKALTKLGR
jgi:RNA polymerase primary sigma factor